MFTLLVRLINPKGRQFVLFVLLYKITLKNKHRKQNRKRKILEEGRIREQLANFKTWETFKPSKF